MKEENEDKQDRMLEKEYGLSDKEIEEYKSGKVLYEEILTGLLKEANTEFRKNDFQSFCFAIQGIWNNLFDADRKFIYEETERLYKADLEKQNKALSPENFKKMMTTNVGETEKISIRQGILSQWKYGDSWRRAYQIIQEVLRKKYQGDIKRYEKDRLTETDK